MSREQAGPAVAHALKTGFRQIDSAWAYRNEDATGDAIRKSGVNRNDLWITSKLWNTFHGEKVEAGLDATLKDLGVDYLDLFLMHWPVAFANPNTSQIPSIKSMGGKPVEESALSNDLAATWVKMEEMVAKGKVRNIGISNCNIRRTEELLQASTATNPVINQVEVNFGVSNEELLHYSEAHQIMLQAYSPLGGPNYSEKYLYDPIIVDVAKRNNITPAQVLLAWPLARGIIPLTKSVNPARIEENFAAASIELPWDDVVHLNNESQARPIDRSMDPTETWQPEQDIFEDYKDQTLLNSLKGSNFNAAQPHEADGSHYLEPRNDPEAPEIGPGGTAVRSMHTMTAGGARPSSSRRPTVLQQVMAGRRRSFASSSRQGAVAEVEAPSAEEVPTVGNSPLLRNSARSASMTPGIKWTDGEAGLERQVRKMNMYTVRGQRSFTSRAASRVYPSRKAFLYNQYRRLLEESKVVLLLQHNSLTVGEFSKLRREIESVDLAPAGPAVSSSKAKLTAIRSGLMQTLVQKSASMKPLEAVFSGPVALLTFDHLSPSYISRILAVIDKALGAGKAQPKPVAGGAHARVATGVNTRVTPLAALVQGSTDRVQLMEVAQLRDIAMLPSLEELRGQIVALLNSPPSQLVATLDQAKGAHLLQTIDARRRDLESPSES